MPLRSMGLHLPLKSSPVREAGDEQDPGRPESSIFTRAGGSVIPLSPCPSHSWRSQALAASSHPRPAPLRPSHHPDTQQCWVVSAEQAVNGQPPGPSPCCGNAPSLMSPPCSWPGWCGHAQSIREGSTGRAQAAGPEDGGRQGRGSGGVGCSTCRDYCPGLCVLPEDTSSPAGRADAEARTVPTLQMTPEGPE